MRKVAAGAVILLGLLAALGAAKSRPYAAPGFAKSGATYAAGGVAKVDTFRVMSRNSLYPNSAAKAAGYIYSDSTRYTTINSASGLTNVAQGVRVGWVSRGIPTTVNAFSASSGLQVISRGGGDILGDAITWEASHHIGFIWVSANGLQNGQRIESAYLMINNDAYGNAIPPGRVLAARLDTISTDYRITAATAYGVGTCNNYAQFNATWNSPNAAIGAAWSPTLVSRNDWHDFGPRSNNVISAGSYAAGTCWRLNVTDAVQQAADNGTLGRGLLFVIYYAGGTEQLGFNAGYDANWVGSAHGKGWPVFTAVSTSRRGSQAWDGMRVPVSFQFDDGYHAQVDYFTALESEGLLFSAVSCSSNVYSHAWVDTLYQLKPSKFYLINHTRVHASLGDMTPGQLAFNMSRDWFPTRFTGFTAGDTSKIVDYALAGGSGMDSNGKVVCALVANGYRSMRSGGYEWTDVVSTVQKQGRGFHHDTRLAWDGYVSKYQIWSVNSRYIFGNPGLTGDATDDEIKEALTDYVDSYYTDYGKAALVIYAHWYKESAPYDYLRADKLQYFLGLVRDLNSCTMANYGDVVAMRLAGATAKTPAQVYAAANSGEITFPDALKIKTMTAQQDSLRLTDPTAYQNLLNIWIGPK